MTYAFYGWDYHNEYGASSSNCLIEGMSKKSGGTGKMAKYVDLGNNRFKVTKSGAMGSFAVKITS